MPRFAFFSLLFLLPYLLLAQSTFTEGYVVGPGGSRQTVEIEDRDWAVNPEQFTYRTAGGAERRGDLSNVSEFGLLPDGNRYIRTTVDLEISPRELNSLSTSSLPEYRRQEVFLEVLVEGAADLFSFNSGSIQQFFYRVGDAPIKPLINRQYRSGDQVVTQDIYRKVLSAILSCEDGTERLEQPTYRRKSLVRYFEEYHRCTGEEFHTYRRPNEPRRFRLALRAGVDQHTTTVGRIYSGKLENPVTYDATYVPRLSVEAELTFSFLHSRWALTGEVYYQAYRQEWPEGATGEPMNVEMKGLNVPLGVRYYIKQSGKMAFYANAYGQIGLPMNGYVEWREFDLDTFIVLTPGAAVGARIANHIQLEARYTPAQDILRRNKSFYHRQHTFSLIGGYQF